MSKPMNKPMNKPMSKPTNKPMNKPKIKLLKDSNPKAKKDDFSSAPGCYEKLSHTGKKVFDMFTYFETQDEEQKLRLEAILEQFDAMHSGKF